MAHHILNHNIPHENIYLIFGCRKFGDCLYGPELKKLSEDIPTFQYIPTFSREVPENENHLIRTGYVHSVYEELCRGKLTTNGEETPQVKPAAFYLCGWKNMIDEAKKRIQDLGYDRKSIHQELYG
jgi:ferredoxin-NADP reductase